MGHPVLRTKTKPISPSEITSAPVQDLIDSMIATMREYHGVGLAAPQVHEGVRLFVAEVVADSDEDEDGEKDGGKKTPEPAVLALVNPEISPIGRHTEEDWEGCLSIPDLRGMVPRHDHVRVKAYDRTGKRIELEANGYMARVIQHEFDHLDGVLFLDRMKSFQTLSFLDEYARYHQG